MLSIIFLVSVIFLVSRMYELKWSSLHSVLQDSQGSGDSQLVALGRQKQVVRGQPPLWSEFQDSPC